MSCVSIVIPTYNGSLYIKKSIESVLRQTYRNLEIIVVDDASTDDTPKIVEEFAKCDSRLRVITSSLNAGLPRALNMGFRCASGQYLTWTSDDNVMWPEAIERLLSVLLKHADAALAYSSYEIIGSDGKKLLTRTAKDPISITDVNVVGPSFLYKRSVALLVGEYNEECLYYEDYDYWLRIAIVGKMVRLDEPCYSYRVHESSMTSRKPPHIDGAVLNTRRRQVHRIAWISCKRKSDAYIRMMKSYIVRRQYLYASWCGIVALYMRVRT